MQYALALSLMRRIYALKKHPLFVEALPENIITRLEYMQENRLTLLMSQEISDLQYIYAYFLNVYHETMYRHDLEGKTHFTLEHGDMQLFREMIQALLRILDPDRLFREVRAS